MNIKRKIQQYYRIVFPSIAYKVIRELKCCYTILDIGCGKKSPLNIVKKGYKIGIDLYAPFLYEAQKKLIHQEYILTDARRIPLKRKSFDAVIALDFLEHLTKEEGYILLKNMEEIAKKVIIVLTPNGYISQENKENPFQRHRSGWTIKDLTLLNFQVFGANGLRHLRGKAGTIKYRPNFLWNVICEITQKSVRHRPHLAYHLLGIKVPKKQVNCLRLKVQNEVCRKVE